MAINFFFFYRELSHLARSEVLPLQLGYLKVTLLQKRPDEAMKLDGGGGVCCHWKRYITHGTIHFLR